MPEPCLEWQVRFWILRCAQNDMEAVLGRHWITAFAEMRCGVVWANRWDLLTFLHIFPSVNSGDDGNVAKLVNAVA